MSRAFFIGPDEGRLLDMGTFEAVVLASREDTDGEFTLLRAQKEPMGFGPPLHIHEDAAEAFYILEGEYRMFVEDREQVCGPGTFVYVPRGMPHTFQVVSEQPGVKLNLFTPAAMIGFFEELSSAKGAFTTTPDLLERIAARHNMTVVGPVPDTYL